MFKKKNFDELHKRYIFLKEIEAEDQKKLEEISMIKESFEQMDSNFVHVALNGNLDFIKRNFDEDYKTQYMLLKTKISNLRINITNEKEFEKFQYLIETKIELKNKLLSENVGEIKKIVETLDNVNNSINNIGNDYSIENRQIINQNIQEIEGIIERMNADKMASIETEKMINDENEIIQRNIERKKLEETLKKHGKIQNTIEESTGGPKI